MDSIWFSIIAKDDSMIHQLCKKIVLETTHGGCHSYFDKRIDANFTALILVKWYYTDLKIDQYSKNWAFASNNFSASFAGWKIFYTRKKRNFHEKVIINNICFNTRLKGCSTKMKIRIDLDVPCLNDAECPDSSSYPSDFIIDNQDVLPVLAYIHINEFLISSMKY